MKLFISADIEGVCGVFSWKQCSNDSERYREARLQMSREVRALCERALEDGYTTITVKDAHNNAYNILHEELPEGVELIRGWARTPSLMMDGLDESYDACAFIGYHSAGFTGDNPLAHSFDTELLWVKINGELVSEFDVNYYYAKALGVPAIFLSGDRALCEHAKKVEPLMRTVYTKDCVGGSAISKHPESLLKEIRESLPAADQDFEMKELQDATVEICYRDHVVALKNSHYPGATLVAPHRIQFTVKDAHQLMRELLFLA